MIENDAFENKSYYKNQIFTFNLSSRPNYCNNLMNYINLEEEKVRKLDFDLKKGMKKYNSSLDLLISIKENNNQRINESNLYIS